MVNNYDMIAEMSLEELAIWLSKIDCWEDTPWVKWLNENCCINCPTIKATPDWFKEPREAEFSYCELEHHCKFGPQNRELEDVDMIKMWLEAEYTKNKAEC